MIFDPSRFVDIHTHILPGADDGAVDVAVSIAMARCYEEQGVRAVIATPHFIPGTAWAAGASRIRAGVQKLNRILRDNDMALTVYPGMEIAYHKKLPERLGRNDLLPLARSEYYLVEPSFSDPGHEVLHCAKMLLQRGGKLIVAHPERIDTFQRAMEPLIELNGDGLQMQLNIGSFLGRYGTRCQKTAFALLKAGSVHYLASDAHAATNRCPPTEADWALLEKELGAAVLETLCVTNPGRLIGPGPGQSTAARLSAARPLDTVPGTGAGKGNQDG